MTNEPDINLSNELALAIRIADAADAIYIGGPGFGARSSADNSIADIERLVAHAHRFNSRIFVTMNTILRDDELEPARKQAGAHAEQPPAGNALGRVTRVGVTPEVVGQLLHGVGGVWVHGDRDPREWSPILCKRGARQAAFVSS